MKINELLVESEQLDELSLKGLGTGLGKAVGGVAGGIAQGAKNIWSGMKQGYAGAQQALAPDDSDASGTAPTTGGTPTPAATPPATGGTSTPATSGTSTPATGGGQAPAGGTTDQLTTALGFTPQTGQSAAAPDAATQARIAAAPQGYDGETGKPNAAPAGQPTAPADGAAPAADQQSKVGVGQINKIIPTLRTRDLNSVKKTVDATLAKKQPAAPTAPEAPAATPPATPPAAPAPVKKPSSRKKAAAPSQAEIDADRARLMGPDNGGANESRVIKFKSRFLGMDI
jgi:hypothetical protein